MSEKRRMRGGVDGIQRRELLVAGGRAALAVTMLPLSSCLESEDPVASERLPAALRAWLGESAGARWIASRSGMTVEEAVRTLSGNVSNRALASMLADEQKLRRFISARRSADFRVGHTHPVRGWWLSETEVAVAVLVTG